MGELNTLSVCSSMLRLQEPASWCCSGSQRDKTSELAVSDRQSDPGSNPASIDAARKVYWQRNHMTANWLLSKPTVLRVLYRTSAALAVVVLGAACGSSGEAGPSPTPTVTAPAAVAPVPTVAPSPPSHHQQRSNPFPQSRLSPLSHRLLRSLRLKRPRQSSSCPPRDLHALLCPGQKGIWRSPSVTNTPQRCSKTAGCLLPAAT